MTLSRVTQRLFDHVTIFEGLIDRWNKGKVEQRNGGTKERRNDGISLNVECQNIPSGINIIISDLDFLSARGFPKLQYNSKFP